MGHVGLTPQSVHLMGGYKVQGKRVDEAQALVDDARALEEAGVFSIVLEAMPESVGRRIPAAVGVPPVGLAPGRLRRLAAQ